MTEKTFYFASIGRRFMAWLVDWIAVAVLSFGLIYLFGKLLVLESFSTVSTTTSLADVNWLISALTLLLPILYYTLFIGKNGQTPGKLLLHIRVVNMAGTAPGYLKAFLRYLVAWIIVPSLAIYGALLLGRVMDAGLGTLMLIPLVSGPVILMDYLWAFFHPRRQTWHDLVAGTYVVKAE